LELEPGGRHVIGIGYEKSEQLDVKPPENFVVVTMRDKRCRPVSPIRRCPI
jgi:hypothetical protein